MTPGEILLAILAAIGIFLSIGKFQYENKHTED